MFPFKRPRPERPPWPTLGVLFALVVLYQLYEWHAARQLPGSARGTVTRLTTPRLGDDAAGRAGDLLLRSQSASALVVAASPNLAGHRPLLGAIVDAEAAPNAGDPLLAFQAETLDASKALEPLLFREPQPFTCSDGSPGVRMYGGFGTDLTEELCMLGDGRFSLKTTARALPNGATLVDLFDAGTHPMAVEGDGEAWDAEHDTSFVATAFGGTALLLESPGMHVTRSFSRFGAEVFASPITVHYAEGPEVYRTLRVVRGDMLHALAELPAATRAFDVTFGPSRGGTVSLRDGADREIASGHVEKGQTRTFRVPEAFGDHLELRDDRGVVTDARAPFPSNGGALTASSGDAGAVSMSYRDDKGAPVSVHVLFKGLGATKNPLPTDASGRVVSAGRSLYLLDGATRVSLPPGTYRITASHGMTYSLSVNEVTVAAGGAVTVQDVVKPVLDTTTWVAADFHLHSAPSPDSNVTLEERIQSLACEGVELAVATDHNRVTSFSSAVQALGVGDRLATAPGVEITSPRSRFGHFNAYPLPVATAAPEEAVPVYFKKLPAEMFASARELGARVVQVNHARMDPGIGYFDLVHLDAATGRASGEFSANFDAFEAYNGMWIEKGDKVREGAVDLVALARRGKRVAALGDSDSHKLLYEEAGYPRTFVHTPRDPIASRFGRVVGVLLGTADTTVTSGPLVELTVDGHGPGSVVSPGAGGSVHVSVRVSAPAWVPVEHVEVWRDDAVVKRFDVTEAPKDGVRFEAELDVPVGGNDATILGWAEASAPLPDVVPYDHALAIGFTGLVYVDGNRDGHVVVPPRAP